jgi:hypothetical protein
MNNKNLIIGGVILAGLVAYYFYNKNKGGGSASSSSSIEPTMGVIPKPYGNTENCEEQFKDYEKKQNMMKVVREPKTPEQYQAYKENWIKNNCKLKM